MKDLNACRIVLEQKLKADKACGALSFAAITQGERLVTALRVYVLNFGKEKTGCHERVLTELDKFEAMPGVKVDR